MGKSYEDQTDAADFIRNHEAILPEIVRITKTGGSICWQVGYHVDGGTVTPLDFIVYRILSAEPQIHLRNRIVWTFGHGLHDAARFSGRHEMLLWFTKGRKYCFNLDNVRVPQKYPGKRAYKGPRRGKFSGNPLGKNPSDVWEIPNVKAGHVEKTVHPCQFPITLAERLIKALTNPSDLVFDPYAGAGTTAAAAVMLGRKFIGAEVSKKFFRIATARIEAARNGSLSYRHDEPVYNPPPNTRLTTTPKEWRRKKAHEKDKG